MKIFACLALFVAVGLSTIGSSSIWLTADQQGQRLLDQQEYTSAAKAFQDPMRQGVAWFRAGEFAKAEQAFSRVTTPEAEYNRGNSLLMRGKYEAAIQRFDRALALRPNWDDALVNRDLAVARAKSVEQKGGDMGDQKIGADEVRYDKNKESGGQEDATEKSQPLASAALQAMWLRRVQTSPADFLKAKFAYQLAARGESGGSP